MTLISYNLKIFKRRLDLYRNGKFTEFKNSFSHKNLFFSVFVLSGFMTFIIAFLIFENEKLNLIFSLNLQTLLLLSIGNMLYWYETLINDDVKSMQKVSAFMIYLDIFEKDLNTNTDEYIKFETAIATFIGKDNFAFILTFSAGLLLLFGQIFPITIFLFFLGIGFVISRLVSMNRSKKTILKYIENNKIKYDECINSIFW